MASSLLFPALNRDHVGPPLTKTPPQPIARLFEIRPRKFDDCFPSGRFQLGAICLAALGEFCSAKSPLRDTVAATLERMSFFQRTKDQLALIVISAIVGGIITFAGTRLTDRIFKVGPERVHTAAPPSN
jgi:hypothetical protein